MIEPGVHIGDRTRIGAEQLYRARDDDRGRRHDLPNVTIRERAKIGDRVILHSGMRHRLGRIRF